MRIFVRNWFLFKKFLNQHFGYLNPKFSNLFFTKDLFFEIPPLTGHYFSKYSKGHTFSAFPAFFFQKYQQRIKLTYYWCQYFSHDYETLNSHLTLKQPTGCDTLFQLAECEVAILDSHLQRKFGALIFAIWQSFFVSIGF